MITSLRPSRLVPFLVALASATGSLTAQPAPTPNTSPEAPRWTRGYFANTRNVLIPWGSQPGDFDFLQRVSGDAGTGGVTEWRINPTAVVNQSNDPYVTRNPEYQIRLFFKSTGFFQAKLKSNIASIAIEEFLSVRTRTQPPPERRKVRDHPVDAMQYEYFWRVNSAEYSISPVPLDPYGREVGGEEQTWRHLP